MMQIKLVLSSFLIVPFMAGAAEWQEPAGSEHTTTVYFQGMMDSQKQCAKYCGPKGMTATTGEHVVIPDSAELIQHPFIGKELDEIVLTQDSGYSWYNPLRFAHHIERYAFAKQLIKYGYQVSNSLPGMPSVATHAIDFFRLNFGQERDIAECTTKVEMAQKKSDGPLILFGASRGAAALFDAHAQHKYDRVKMLVLEGCFDSVEHTMDKRAPSIIKKIGLHKLFHRFLSAVTEYKPDGINPLKAVDAFPKDVPVVFVTSKADSNVHRDCTYALIEKLRAKKQNPVHVLTLDTAGHNHYALGNGPDQKRYLQFLHSLYKKYGLPYIAEHVKHSEN